jgi:DNA-binding transcriptional ArsR family regulator
MGKKRKGEKQTRRHSQPDDSGRLGQAELLRALSHPTRVKILSVVAERPASPTEMYEEIGETLGNTSYHARVLCEYGLIEVVEEQQVRGAVEHFYRAVERPLFDEECWAALDPAVKRAISGYGIETIMRDASTALKSGTFDKRDERHLSRTPMLLDAEGFRNVAKILNDALDAILVEQAASAERRNNSDEPGVPTIAVMASFELPERPPRGS